MRRWVTRLLAVAIVALGLPAVASAGPAAAAPGYIDGGFSNSTIINCGSIIFGNPYQELGLMTHTGYYGDLNSNPPSPKVGDTFYVHVVVGGAGNSCSGQLAWVDVALPAGLSAAVSNVNPVHCYYTDTKNVTGAVPCKAMSSPFRSGAISIAQPGNNYNTEVWPVPTGGTLDLRLPVTATQAGAMTLQAYVQASDGNSNPLLTPNVGMYVAPSGTVSSTTIAYRSPSTVITPGATPAYKSTGLLSNVVAGTARMRLGTTTAYTLMSDPVAGTIPAGNWSIYSDWTPTATNFIPGLTYHWALCFKPTGGSEQCGTDQTFVAVAADSTRPTINSVTYLGAEAGTVQDPVRGNSVAFRLTFSEPVKDLTNCLFISQAGIAVGQATWSPLSGLSTSYVVTIPLTEIGQGAVGVSVGTTCPSKITDAAGNTLSNSLSKSVTIDRLAPDTTAPAISTAALPGVSLTNPLQTWTASDAGGLASFQMKSRTTTRTGVVGAWSAPTILGRTVRQAPLAIVPGTTRCDQVTAYDTAQNHTAGAIRCTVTPLDERATLNTGVWTKFANTAAFGATLSRSTQVGATKYLPGVKGHSVVLVARKQPGAGTVQVLVNGVVKYTWNLASPTVQNKQVLNLTVPAGFTNARVSVRVKAAGTAGVWIDALGVGA